MSSPGREGWPEGSLSGPAASGKPPKGGEDAIPSTAVPHHRAGFREEADRFVIANHQFSLGFSTLANGTVCGVHVRPSEATPSASLRAGLVSAEEAVADGFLWRVTLDMSDGTTAAITNRNCDEFAFRPTAEADGALRLRMDWSRMRVGVAPIAGAVAVEILFPADGWSALATFQGEWPDQVLVSAVEFPCICALGASDPGAEEFLFLPLSGGVLIPEPRGLVVPGAGTRWEAAYPGPSSVQLIGYSCGREASVALACHDPSGLPKTLSAGGMPRSNRLILSTSARPRKEEDGVWRLRHPASIILAAGDWFEVAEEYRDWAVHQPWCARGRGGLRELPALTAAHGLWFSFWGGPRAVVTVTRELQRIVSVPLKLDWRCWHGCARGGAYPDYLPPRDGDQVFAQAKKQLADAGVLTQIGFSGFLASPISEAWRQDEAGYRASSAGVVSEEDDQLVPMCPAARRWQERLVGLTREVAARAEGLYLEDILAAAPLHCQNPDHVHPADVGGAWVSDVRRLLEQMRSNIGTHTHLAADGASENYLDLVDVFFTPLAAAEREALFPAQFGNRWTPIPLFSAIYHPYCTLVGSGISLVNNRPFDPMWTAETIAALHEPEELMQRGFPRQFYLEAARSIVWGHQLMVDNFNLRQARDEGCRRKLAFLTGALLAQGWGVGKLLPFSESCGLLDVSAQPVDVEMLVNPPRAMPEERTVTRRRLSPVLGSAWNTPGAGIALVLANIYEQPVEFSAPLRASRLGVSGKLQVVGRTFTPDGEAPPARLHASSSEISGRLPAGAVFLVTMRPEGVTG